MTNIATPIKIKLDEAITLDAYQIHQEGEEITLFTHRQISEAVGRSKSTVHSFLKKNVSDFPEPIYAKIPDRPRPVPLTSFDAAVGYWKKQSTLGNIQARDILDVIDEIENPEIIYLEEVDNTVVENEILIDKEAEVINNTIFQDYDNFDKDTNIDETFFEEEEEKFPETETIEQTNTFQTNIFETNRVKTPKVEPYKVIGENTFNNFPNSQPTSNEFISKIAKGIEIASRWMSAAGVDQTAILHWQLSELGKQVPELEAVTMSAREIIGRHMTSPSGMIPSQLAEEISLKLSKKVKAADVNKELHSLGFQDWAKPGVNRERKLTELGKKYGISILTTSKDGWQGAQIRWFDSVLPILYDRFRKKYSN